MKSSSKEGLEFTVTFALLLIMLFGPAILGWIVANPTSFVSTFSFCQVASASWNGLVPLCTLTPNPLLSSSGYNFFMLASALYMLEFVLAFGFLIVAGLFAFKSNFQ